MTRLRLEYIHRFRDRHGKVRHYARMPGRKQVPLPGRPFSEEFMLAYQAALSGLTTSRIGASKTKPGTFSALLVSYYQSEPFTSLSASTKEMRRRELERFRNDSGEKRVAHLRREHVQAILAKKLPFAKANFLKALRGLMSFAVDTGWRDDDPTAGLKIKKPKSEGHVTWTEEHIATFEARHPVGTTARLAMGLMHYTGCRRGDVVRLGRQQIKNGVLTYTQQKNKERAPVTIEIPVHRELRTIIDATLNEHLTFLVTTYGKPFTAKGFGGWMRDRCDEAGLPDCSSHGLRKAISRRMAEALKTPHEIMSVTGHKTLTEVERYTRAAGRKKLAVSAMDFEAPRGIPGTGIGKPK